MFRGWIRTLAIAGLLTSTAFAEVSSVWAVNDGEKVRAGDVDSPLAAGNSAWNNGKVTVFGAANEVVAFQVVVQSDEAGATVEDIALPVLTGPMDFRIRNIGSASHESYVGKRIEIFTEHYIEVKTPTGDDTGGWWWSREAKPVDVTGMIPDCLVPIDAREGRGGLPVSVKGATSQAFWVDIYVPEHAPAGKYRGTLTLRFRHAESRSLSVELEVLGFALPNETHFRTMVYFSRSNLEDRYGPAAPSVAKAFRQMAHRHRFDLISGYDFNEMPELAGYLDGTRYTAEEGYQGPGEGVGDRVFSIGTYGRPVLGGDIESWHRESDSWVKWMAGNASKALFFLYITDEPPESRFPWIRERTGWLKSNTGPGRNLPVLVTKEPVEELEGAIDIWMAPARRLQVAEVGVQHDKGRLIGFYNSFRPATGSVMLDAPAVDFRTFPWIARRYDVDLYFYWESTHWRQNGQGTEARRARNVFKEPGTFTLGGPRQTANGSGTFFYPGRDLLYPEEDRDVNAPLSSIRMKNLRRGQQDYEYMWLASESGKAAEAEAVLREIIPAALNDAKGGPAWPEDGSSWDVARRKLGGIIESGQEKEASEAGGNIR